MFHLCPQQPKSAENARCGRHEHPADPQQLGQCGGMNRAGSPEGHHGELRRIATAFHRHRLDRADHV
jgi:hypothetical protein